MILSFLFISLATAAHLSHVSGAWAVNLPNTEYFEDSLCTQDAVAEYLEECSRKGPDNVEPSIRLRSAVRLSVCEFRAARVEYPESCEILNSQESYSQCVQDFRATSQLWTTYSGNWRKLRSACHEEAAPFIKSHILDLFFNVTELFSQFFESASASYKNSETFSHEAVSKLNVTLQVISNMQARVDLFERNLEDIMEKMASMMDSSWESWDTAQARAETFFDHFDTGSTEAMDFFQKMSANTEKQVELWADTEEAISAKQASLFDDHMRRMGMVSSRFQQEMEFTLGSALAKSQNVASILDNLNVDIAGTFQMMESHVGQVAKGYLSQAQDEFSRLQNVIEKAALSAQHEVKEVVDENLQSLMSVSKGLEAQVASLQNVVTNVETIGFTSLFPFIQSFTWSLKFIGAFVPIFIIAMCSKTIRKCLTYFCLGLSVAMALRVCADYI